MTTKKKDTSNKDKTYTSQLTNDDLQMLGKKGLSMDTGDDRLLQHRTERIDFTGKDLDIPTKTGSNPRPTSNIPDEENTLFGQGGERKENLEAPQRANTKKD